MVGLFSIINCILLGYLWIGEMEEARNLVDVAEMSKRHAEQRQQEAETKLKVLKEYYNEKELEMQK